MEILDHGKSDKGAKSDRNESSEKIAGLTREAMLTETGARARDFDIDNKLRYFGLGSAGGRAYRRVHETL